MRAASLAAPPSRSAAPAARAAARPHDPDYMLSLARGLLVIRAFGQAGAALSVADVAASTRLSRAAARRCLHTLSVLGYAASVDGGYTLTPGVLALGYAYLGSTSLARAAQPVLERVSDELHESCSVAVLDGDDIVYLARAATRRILSIGLAVGSRLPAAATSMGRVLIAYADAGARAKYLARVKLVRHTDRTIVEKGPLAAEFARIRTQGYAVVDQELELGLRSIAAPILGADRSAMAAINVGVHAGRTDARTLQREFLPVLRAAALEIAAATGQHVSGGPST